LTREFTFIAVVYRKAFGPESSQDISGGQREWLMCCQTRQSAFWWHHVLPSETHKLQFLMDLDVNATDERIYSEFRGLHSSNFLAWYVNAMSSAYWDKFEEENGRPDMYRLKNIGAKTLPCGKPLFHRRHPLCSDFRRTRERSGLTAYGCVE
jgi:hypothetical protein